MKKLIIVVACLASSTAAFAGGPGGDHCNKNYNVLIRWFCAL